MPDQPPIQLPVPAPGVMFQALDDGAVLFSMDSEVYFGLNHAGAAIWELLPPATTTLPELVAALGERYPDADAETIERDVVGILDELTQEGLLVPADAAERGGDDEPGT